MKDRAVLPPTRIAESKSYPTLACLYDFKTAIEDSELIAHVKIGDWLGEDDNAKLVHIGDLLIASGTEVDRVEVDIDGETVTLDGVITNIEWQHVPSGYVADYNHVMDVTVVDNTAEIKLTSGVNKDDDNAANDGDLGRIVIAADSSSSLTITKNESGNVTIGMVWGSFEEEEA